MGWEGKGWDDGGDGWFFVSFVVRAGCAGAAWWVAARDEGGSGFDGAGVRAAGGVGGRDERVEGGEGAAGDHGGAHSVVVSVVRGF